ncbi:MAG: CRISPR-associated endonuclease Cas3'', partial [Candidatus Cloacimonetes bacterium]|nr:CRISPR-associated endonuclease Cas3'' [Candidatus Cloacimonadota bacterium]
MKDHLTQVTNTGISRFSTNRVFMEYAQLFKVILSFHDLGKGSGYFQRYLLDNAPRTNLTRHSEFSAIWAYYYCLTELKLEGLDCLLVYVCVISHHADMDNFSELLSPNLSADELMLISENTDYEELNAILSDL